MTKYVHTTTKAITSPVVDYSYASKGLSVNQLNEFTFRSVNYRKNWYWTGTSVQVTLKRGGGGGGSIQMQLPLISPH